MAMITQKNCAALFPLWFLKKIDFVFRGRGKADVNQQKHKKLKFKFDRKSYQYYENYNNNYYLIDNKYKNRNIEQQ